MPSVKLTDQFGLDLDVETSLLAGLSKINLKDLNLKSLVDLTLAAPSVTSLHSGLNFGQPVDIGTGATTLSVKAGVNGALDIYVPPPTGGAVCDDGRYGDKILVAPSERYVSLTVNASAGANAGASSLGFEAGAGVTVANYRKFGTQPAPLIVDAVRDTIAAFRLPASPDDLRGLDVDTIVTMEGVGTLAFSAQANLFAATNPLATLALPSPLPALDVTAGGSITVAASCTMTWDYQLRIRKLDAGRVSVGFYRKHGSEIAVSVKAGEGISAGISGTDLFSTLIGVISKSADATSLQTLGLPKDQLNAIGDAVKNAVQRKLEVSVMASLTAGDSQSAAFLYEFDLSTNGGDDALAAALHGDLSALTGGSMPTGVKMVRSIATDLRHAGITWKINLLGVYNFISTTELVRQGTVLFEPITGDLVVTDKATAKRVTVGEINFGADSDKLRNVLAESFLITAVYRGSQSMIGAPEIACSHSYFALHASTGADEMRAELAAAAALGLLGSATVLALLGLTKNFGRTAVYAEMTYAPAATPSLFLNGADPKPIAEYETSGREALRLLLPDDPRRRAVSDDHLWASMRQAGQPGFGAIFPDLPPTDIGAITADYSVIVWWAKAMAACAQSVATMNALLAINPDPQSVAFQRARTDLGKKLADVTSDTKEEFGQPWGLIAMDRVSGGRAAAKVQITGAQITLAQSRTETLAATAPD